MSFYILIRMCLSILNMSQMLSSFYMCLWLFAYTEYIHSFMCRCHTMQVNHNCRTNNSFELEYNYWYASRVNTDYTARHRRPGRQRDHDPDTDYPVSGMIKVQPTARKQTRESLLLQWLHHNDIKLYLTATVTSKLALVSRLNNSSKSRLESENSYGSQTV